MANGRKNFGPSILSNPSSRASAVDTSGSRGATLDEAVIATVENGKIIPVSIDEFDARFSGSGGGLSASAAMTRCLGC